MDVLWFRLPRWPADPAGVLGRGGRGKMMAMLDRGDYGQVGYVIPKGAYQELRQAGLAALKRSLAELMPELADRLESLQEWRQVALLTVEANRLPRWHRPGLLLIGDAAHVASPVGGAGINLAIHDAVVLSQTGCQCQLIDLDRSLVGLQEDRVRIGRGE